MMVGSKFSKDMDTAEIAKRIRSDIREAQRSGTLSQLVKSAVRTARFSGGSSIHITVLQVPFLVTCPEYIAAAERSPHVHLDMHRWTPRARKLIEQLEGLGNEYRFDESDSMTDYFHTNFYFSVTFASDLEREEREMIVAAVRANGPCPPSVAGGSGR